MPPEYITKEEYEKGYEKLVERYEKLEKEYNEKLFKLRKQIQEEQRAREEERDKLKDRLWTERIVYITIIIGAVSILTTIIVMMM